MTTKLYFSLREKYNLVLFFTINLMSPKSFHFSVTLHKIK